MKKKIKRIVIIVLIILVGIGIFNGVVSFAFEFHSVANYKYDDDKVLWTKGKNDTDYSAKEKDKDPTKGQKEKQNYTPAKWDIEKYVTTSKLINNDKSNVNWYFLRYADVLLLYAEALNEWKHGPTDEAYEAINMVRRRGFGNPSKTSICDLKDLNEEDFRKAVYQERAYELAFEGHRRMDLIRWGIYYETIQKTYNDLLTFYSMSVNNIIKFSFRSPQRDMDWIGRAHV